MTFQDSVVWITGGGSGLGRAMAVEFSRQGASVAVSGRRAERLEETVAALPNPGLAVRGDVNNDADLASAVAAVVHRFGKLDVAVANAGFGVSGKICDLDRDAWRRQLELNVISVAMTARAAIPELTKQRGRLALVGSVAAFTPFPGSGPYTASKAAVLAIGRTLSAELKPVGVSTTTLQPGFVESEIGRVTNHGEFDPSRTDRRPAQLLWKADDAARVMVRAIYRRKVEYTFTGHGRLAVLLGRHAPWLVQAAANYSAR